MATEPILGSGGKTMQEPQLKAGLVWTRRPAGRLSSPGTPWGGGCRGQRENPGAQGPVPKQMLTQCLPESPPGDAITGKMKYPIKGRWLLLASASGCL